MEHDYKPGRQLVRVQLYRDGEVYSISRVKIAKVYKTGKIITDDTRDKSPSSGFYQFGWDGECFRETRRTSSFGSSVYLYPLKEEKRWMKRHQEELLHRNALQVQNYLAGRLKHPRWLRATPDQLARINAILNEEVSL